MNSPIRCADELSRQSLVPGGLSDPKIILPNNGLGHLAKYPRQSPPLLNLILVWATRWHPVPSEIMELDAS